MRRWRGAWLFPLILAVTMGGMSFWLNRISHLETEEVRLNPKEPQYEMTGMQGQRFDQNGQLKERLSAQAAWQLPDSNELHFRQPEADIYRDGVPIYRVVAGQGRYDTGHKHLFFDDDVVLTQNAVGSRLAGRVETRQLQIDTGSQIARTQAPVKFQYGLSHGSAVGFVYDHDQNFLNLHSRVKAVIYDPKP